MSNSLIHALQKVIWIVTGLFVAGCSAIASLGVIPGREAPTAVADAFTLPATPHVTLAWDDPDNMSQEVGGYYVYYWQPEWATPRRVDVGKQTTHTLTGLEAGQTYTFAVTVYGSGKSESPYSRVVSQRVPTEKAPTLPKLTVEAPGVLANDAVRDGATLQAMLVSGTTHGTVVLRKDGGFIYMPKNNFSGSDSFTYRATDGTLTSQVVTVTITVKPAVLSRFPSSSHPGEERATSLSHRSRANFE